MSLCSDPRLRASLPRNQPESSASRTFLLLIERAVGGVANRYARISSGFELQHATETNDDFRKRFQSRDRSELGARYSLLLSIEAPIEDVDLWTPSPKRSVSQL